MKIMKITVACAIYALLATPALAVDSDAVLKRLEESLNINDIKVLGGEVTTEGNNIIVKNFGIEMAALEGAENLTLRLNDIVEADDGSFTIGKVLIDEAALEIAGDRIDISGLELEQVYLPVKPEPSYTYAYMPYQSVGLKGFTFYKDGKPGFIGGNSHVRVRDFEADKRVKFEGAVDSFSFDIDSFGAEAADGVRQMGYETLSGKIGFSGGSDFEAAIMDVEYFAFSLDNIGTLSMKMQLGGYTKEVAKAAAEISEKADDSQATGLALMGLAQQLTFNNFSLRFDDHSITNKILDYAAENMGSSRSDVISMASAMTQFGLGNLQHVEFATKVSQAVGAYLNAPGSIELKATPAQPLPVMVIAGAAQDPKNLIDVLAVEVNANQ